MTDQNIVTCINGHFIGIENNGVLSFKGIPFAKPPVGKLRWREPVPVSASEETYEAFEFAPSPIQTKLASERASLREQSEDCLYLNIWTDAATIGTEKPVMVFIHGGSYGWGGTADPLYDGQRFIEAHPDVVLVTIAYRVGLLGFIDFSEVPGGKTYSKSGNLGILDQICALKYVRDNIKGFGGDPSNVTIFGESAGGGSVSLLPLIPGAKGLFKRVIAESGSVALTFSRKECQNLTQELLKATGAKTVADLVALPIEKFCEANEDLNEYNNFPERDGVVLSEHLYEDYMRGMASGVDMMIGTNADEMKYWIADLGSFSKYMFMCDFLYENNMKRVSEEDKRRVDAFMKIQSLKGRHAKQWSITEFYNEMMFRLPAVRQADFHADAGGKTYLYYWKYPSGIENLGACHAVELAYVFNNLDETIYAGDNIDPNLAKLVQQMWVNFAKTGDPGTVDGITWEQYNTKKRPTMVFDKKSRMGEDIKSLQRELLDPLLDYGFNGSHYDLTPQVPVVYKTAAKIAAGVAAVGIAAAFIYHFLKKRR